MKISIDRQVHFVAALILISGLTLQSVNANSIYLAYLVAFGLSLDAITGFCPMRFILSKFPFNKA